jgi:hypothetical protein
MLSSATFALHFAPTGTLLEAARRCEAEVFLQAYGNTTAQLDSEYRDYDGASVFLALTDAREDVVGACRVITPSAAGLKTLDDTLREPWGVDGYRSATAARIDVGRTWDVATLGVRSGLRGRGMLVASALYHGLIVAIEVNEVRTIVMTLDERVRTLLSTIGLITHPLPGTFAAPYLGSAASTPVYGHYAEMRGAQRRINMDAHRLVAQGVGLDGVRVPPREAFRLPVPARSLQPAGFVQPFAVAS